MVNGTELAIIEVLGCFFISHQIKHVPQLQSINNISYYWVMFTILTGLWELAFIKKQIDTTLKKRFFKKQLTSMNNQDICLDLRGIYLYMSLI